MEAVVEEARAYGYAERTESVHVVLSRNEGDVSRSCHLFWARGAGQRSSSASDFNCEKVKCSAEHDWSDFLRLWCLPERMGEWQTGIKREI